MNMISSKTSLVAVLGDPIKHSLSPTIHNAALREMNLDWNYMALPCEARNLELVLSALRAIDCKGLNITIPHKTNSIQYCMKISSLSKQVGAINTLIPNKEGGWFGENTDVEGFISPLKTKKSWVGKNALIIGCGGSARAIFAGLAKLQFKKICIINRNENSLNKFLMAVKKSESNLIIKGFLPNNNQIEEIITNSDLIINTTPVGMYKSTLETNDINKVPLGSEIWKNLVPGTILYDLIYNPKPTEWLQIGLEKDCAIIDGLEMLIQQGAASLRLWTGKKEIPIDIMRKAANSYMN